MITGTPAATEPPPQASPRAILLRELHDPYLVDVALAHYNDPQRHYHDAWHVAEMFTQAHNLGFTLGPEQKLAILFHDYDLDPNVFGGSNERQSTASMRRLFNEDPRLRIYARFIDEAAAIILDTVDHAKATIPAARAILDLDLARLGCAWPEFQRHTDELYQERRPYLANDEAFTQGTAAFYRNMLARPSIFHTPEGQASFEANARQNMVRALKALEADPLPGLLRRSFAAVESTRRMSPTPG